MVFASLYSDKCLSSMLCWDESISQHYWSTFYHSIFFSFSKWWNSRFGRPHVFASLHHESASLPCWDESMIYTENSTTSTLLDVIFIISTVFSFSEWWNSRFGRPHVFASLHHESASLPCWDESMIYTENSTTSTLLDVIFIISTVFSFSEWWNSRFGRPHVFASLSSKCRTSHRSHTESQKFTGDKADGGRQENVR